jgi:hypothetical protein
MALLFFWIKVAIKRILDLSKPYILFALCIIIFIGAFVYAFISGHININFDIKTIYIIISLIIFLSLFNLFRNYNVIPILIKYSKCKYQNKIIIIRYFLKRALVNNSVLIIFNIIAFYSIIKYSAYFIHIFILPGITILSIILSFVIMYIKNKYLNNKYSEISNRKLKANPLIKSAVYDYLSSDFLISLILCIILFIVFTINIARNTNNFYELKHETNLFVIITLLFSIGFTGIIGSIPNINWKFQAIISPNSFKYHLKRTFLVLAVFFGWIILLYIILGSFINIILTIKYLYCIFVISFTTVNISFSIINIMIKMLLITIIIVLTLWVTTIPLVFLPVLIIPVIITFMKAKDEYREWYLV